MGILLGFLPFIAFALLNGFSISLGLWLAFAAAFVITIRDFVESPTLRLLDAGSVIVFAALAVFTGFIKPSMSLQSIRLIVESAFLVLALASLVIRRPLTLAYGHEHISEDRWKTPDFVRGNYILTAAWALAFAIMTAADAVTSIKGETQLPLDIAVGLAILGLVVAFTVRYPAALATRDTAVDTTPGTNSANKP